MAVEESRALHTTRAAVPQWQHSRSPQTPPTLQAEGEGLCSSTEHCRQRGRGCAQVLSTAGKGGGAVLRYNNTEVLHVQERFLPLQKKTSK